MALIIAGLLVVERRHGVQVSAAPRERRLIISTDDAGMCSSVNVASIAALKCGAVTSASIMTCCPAFEEFAAFAAANRQYDYGVHLTLTCDLPQQPWGPVLPADEVSSLVDNLGYFWPTTGEIAQRASIEDAERELRAQIIRALRAGIRITHIDHHMFVLYDRPDFLDLYSRLAAEFNLPARLCSEPGSASWRRRDPDWLLAYRRCAASLQEAGLPLLDALESDNYSQDPMAKRAYHLRTLRDLPFGVTELVVHCADIPRVGVAPPDVERRAADVRFFLSAEAREEINRLRIHRIGWADLPRSGSSSR
jgi:predicted glycoside hydrolase/deacetylase ChbG (UPF0249 family)